MISNTGSSHECKLNINMYMLGAGEGNGEKNRSLSLQDIAHFSSKNYTFNKSVLCSDSLIGSRTGNTYFFSILQGMKTYTLAFSLLTICIQFQHSPVSQESGNCFAYSRQVSCCIKKQPILTICLLHKYLLLYNSDEDACVFNIHSLSHLMCHH